MFVKFNKPPAAAANIFVSVSFSQFVCHRPWVSGSQHTNAYRCYKFFFVVEKTTDRHSSTKNSLLDPLFNSLRFNLFSFKRSCCFLCISIIHLKRLQLQQTNINCHRTDVVPFITQMAKMNNFSTTTETLPKSGHVTEGKLAFFFFLFN